MGKVHEIIDEPLRRWIEAQHLVFVGTAALSGDATVNLSPKGMAGTFEVLDDHRCAYLDLTGSGVETIAHLRENGRITVMWCAFDGPPRSVRIHGTGQVVEPTDPEWADLSGHFPALRGARAIIVITAARISDSCGYSVPLMEFVDDRPTLANWAEKRTDEELEAYRELKNSVSIDGLPGL
ncbi:pyridoxamine 5'-phosphate oxidase family protein [soil metagenome]